MGSGAASPHAPARPRPDKAGLVPNEEAGYPLIEGVPIKVSIDARFRDAAGRSLRSGAERRYDIVPPLRVRVNPLDWRCHCPAVGSTDPLTVEFDRPLDHALLEHSLWVNDASGAALAGRGSAGAGREPGGSSRSLPGNKAGTWSWLTLAWRTWRATRSSEFSTETSCELRTRRAMRGKSPSTSFVPHPPPACDRTSLAEPVLAVHQRHQSKVSCLG